jgi:hypothetical protein
MIRYLFATQSIASRANSEPVAAVLGRGHGFPVVALPSVLSVFDPHFGAKPAGCVAGCSIGAGNVSDHRTDRPNFGLLVADIGLSLGQQILELPILGHWLNVRNDRSGRYECSNSISVPRED